MGEAAGLVAAAVSMFYVYLGLQLQQVDSVPVCKQEWRMDILTMACSTPVQ